MPDCITCELAKLTDRLTDYRRRRPRSMTPKLQGALQALKMLQHDVETDAEEMVAKVNDLQARRKSAKAKTHGALDQAGTSLGDIEEFVSGLEGSNGAPNSSGSPSPQSALATEAATKPAEGFPAAPVA